MHNFKRGNDLRDTLNIGFVKLTRDWLESHDINYTTIERAEETGKTVFYIDVEGDVYLPDFHINDVFDDKKFPAYIKFRKVTGRFILGNGK